MGFRNHVLFYHVNGKHKQHVKVVIFYYVIVRFIVYIVPVSVIVVCYFFCSCLAVKFIVYLIALCVIYFIEFLVVIAVRLMILFAMNGYFYQVLLVKIC